jgi:hypothetical protein
MCQPDSCRYAQTSEVIKQKMADPKMQLLQEAEKCLKEARTSVFQALTHFNLFTHFSFLVRDNNQTERLAN